MEQVEKTKKKVKQVKSVKKTKTARQRKQVKKVVRVDQIARNEQVEIASLSSSTIQNSKRKSNEITISFKDLDESSKDLGTKPERIGEGIVQEEKIEEKPNNLQTSVKKNRSVKKVLMLIFIPLLITSIVLGVLYLAVFHYQEINSEDLDKKINNLVNQYRQNNPETATTSEDATSTATSTKEEVVAEFYDSNKILFIPSIGVEIGIFSGNESALEKGAWHRFSDRSDPVKGGNFVLSAHRFLIGTNIFNVRKQSPLINIDKLRVGAEIIIVWNDRVFKYEVKEIFTVGPFDSYIEDNAFGNILTLYTCTLGGRNDGRVVVRAEMTTEVF